MYPLLYCVILRSVSVSGASRWHCNDLTVSVPLPQILCIEDEEVAEALERFFNREFVDHDAVAPLMFVFTFMQDMHTFLEHAVN